MRLHHGLFIKWHVYGGGFWFRIFGFGVVVMDRTVFPAPFSVRVGAVKEWRIGKWGIKGLKP